MHQYFSFFQRRILELWKTLSENFSTVLFCFCILFSQLCIGIPYLPVYINAHPIFQDGFQNIDLNLFFSHLTLSLYHSILSSHKTFGTEKIIDKYPQCKRFLTTVVKANCHAIGKLFTCFNQRVLFNFQAHFSLRNSILASRNYS